MDSGVAVEDLRYYTRPEKDFRHGASVITKLFSQGAGTSETALPERLVKTKIQAMPQKTPGKLENNSQDSEQNITPLPPPRIVPVAPSRTRNLSIAAEESSTEEVPSDDDGRLLIKSVLLQNRIEAEHFVSLPRASSDKAMHGSRGEKYPARLRRAVTVANASDLDQINVNSKGL